MIEDFVLEITGGKTLSKYIQLYEILANIL